MVGAAHRWAAVLCCWGAMGALLAVAAEPQGPSKLELSGAEHRMAAFEAHVQRMRGQPFALGFNEKDTLKRIKALCEKYPNDERVKALFARARKAIVASKGDTVDVKPGAVAFRENGKKLQLLFAEEGEKQFNTLMARVQAEKSALLKPFPSADPTKTNADDMVGRSIVLPGFRYPENEFTFFSSQYCFVGSGARGYYYVQLNNRAWVGAREALRRYCRQLGIEIPQDVEWTIIGKIAGVHLLVPQAGKKKTKSAFVGWLVDPTAIYVPDYTLAVSKPELELGGAFAGEERVDAIKSPMYTVRSVPDDVTPERLVEIFATAIMEKNHELYLDCIDPRRRETLKGIARINYHWDLHQHRFATFYVKVVVGKASVWTVEGFDANDEFDSIFLTEEERKKIAATAKPLVESAEVKSKAYDERGRQYGSPKPHFLRRVAKKRWYITNYEQPF